LHCTVFSYINENNHESQFCVHHSILNDTAAMFGRDQGA